MEILGFENRDFNEDRAFEEGALFEYKFGKDGDLNIRSLLLGDDNPVYTRKFAELAATTVRPVLDELSESDALKREASWNYENQERMAGLVFDHCVIDWNTTIKTKAGSIESNRENFIALMAGKKTSHIFDMFLRDASTRKNYQISEEALGNLLTPLDGS